MPYIASGGVAAGSQLAAALAMGADGVNCGTLFCVTKESVWHENQKKAIVEGDELDTTLVSQQSVQRKRSFIHRIGLLTFYL